MKGGSRGRHWQSNPENRGRPDPLAYYRARAGSASAAARAKREGKGEGESPSVAAPLTGAETIPIPGKTLRVRLPNKFSVKTSLPPSSPPPAWQSFPSRIFGDEISIPLTLPSETRFGEIIAHRIWRVREDRLFSTYMASKWTPGEPMRGEAEYNALSLIFGGSKGVHAWKELGQHLTVYAADLRLFHMTRGIVWQINEANLLPPPPTLVIGKVRLYGTVIEHEHGYRAEAAMIESLDTITGEDLQPGLLDFLRDLYTPTWRKRGELVVIE